MKSVDQKQVCFQKVVEPANQGKSAMVIIQISVCVYLTSRVAGRQRTFFPLVLLASLTVLKRDSQWEKEMCVCHTVTHGAAFGTSLLDVLLVC